MGRGEIDYNNPRVPPSVKQGRTGGVGEAAGQGDILECGLKGGAGPLPAPDATDGSVNTVVSKRHGEIG
jgi:hypothetical protein